jgi:signal transduction histidine kinase
LQPLQIKYDFEYLNISERLPNKIEVTLYRITQELINNIIKHSGATSVDVQLIKTEQDVIFMLEDNGKGLKNASKEGMGLQNIKSRIDIIKGSVNFNSEEIGTLTTIKIPL